MSVDKNNGREVAKTGLGGPRRFQFTTRQCMAAVAIIAAILSSAILMQHQITLYKRRPHKFKEQDFLRMASMAEQEAIECRIRAARGTKSGSRPGFPELSPHQWEMVAQRTIKMAAKYRAEAAYHAKLARARD
jgi:hypothetical protein